MTAWMFLVFAIICNIAGAVFVKIASLKNIDTKLGSYFTLEFFLAITFFGLNLLLITQALKKIPLTVAYPILIGATLVGVSIISVFIFSERVTLFYYFGIAMIAIGVAILS